MKKSVNFAVSNISEFQNKAIAWANDWEVCCCLLHNSYPHAQYHDYETVIAVGAKDEILIQKDSKNNAFAALKKFQSDTNEMIFGFLSYDLKNQVEDLTSHNFDGIGFPDLFFFNPIYVIEIKKNEIIIRSEKESPDAIFEQILSKKIIQKTDNQLNIKIKPRISYPKYLQTVRSLQEHICAGDVYEINFCQEFFAENCVVEPLPIFFQLNEKSAAPFSAYFRLHEKYVCCASPERFLKKENQRLVSQPVKGTRRRGASESEDQKIANELKISLKDRAENVMIVDLVRNDLARCSRAGTVEVEELFGIYRFRQVQQMISTVVSELRSELDWSEALRFTFPMGSMTGAPKVMSMQLIEQYEQTRRGLFSGAIGYVTKDGDFDFNVVIRSIFYNEKNKYLSFQVGGAIVFDSEAEEEYAECLLKAKAMLEVLGARI